MSILAYSEDPYKMPHKALKLRALCEIANLCALLENTPPQDPLPLYFLHLLGSKLKI